MTTVVQVGCGYWGKNLTRNFAEIGALAGVVDGNPETAKAMAEAHGALVMTFKQALDNPAVDAISLATPAETHAALATRALNAGKHVYVEKPLSLEVSDAEALVALAEQKGLRLMVGHLLQYHPVFLALKAHVKAGLIGDIRYLYSNRLSYGKFRVEENVLWSFAPHDFSMILSLVGEEPASITAQGASYVTPGLADWCSVQMAFSGGVRGHVLTSWAHPFKEQRLVVAGSGGILVFEDSEPVWEKKLALYPHSINRDTPVPLAEKGEAKYLTVEKGEPLKEECRHFIACIEMGKTPRTDGQEGLAVLRALTRAEVALATSLREGST
ncbi:MAG: Gfo/Idh/MocA family oxidoreductase [Rhodobacteraceae bacterium]|nr:Gfo/Idh/MocA family oxidoreductase [Paracoccaceae bacterium]